MELPEFKKHLLGLIANCKMDIFFDEIETCSFLYDKSFYNSLKDQYLATSPFLNPCAMYSTQCGLLGFFLNF